MVGDGDAAPLRAAAGDGSRCTAGTTCCAGKPDRFDWPEVDEHDAAALCYTSGTTGNPKGVAYSPPLDLPALDAGVHGRRRSASARPTGSWCIVPMFHAMAWGLPYAAFMAGASLIMPDRFLQAAPIAAMIAAERPTLAGAVPTIWTDLLAYLDSQPDRHLLAARGRSSAARPARRR